MQYSVQCRTVWLLRNFIQEAEPPPRLQVGSLMSDGAHAERTEWFRERDWILNEFSKLESKEGWWSDSEYEWFIIRMLDFLEGDGR